MELLLTVSLCGLRLVLGYCFFFLFYLELSNLDARISTLQESNCDYRLFFFLGAWHRMVI